MVALAERLSALKEARRVAMEAPQEATDWFPYSFTGQTVSQAWEAAERDDRERRDILRGQLRDGTFTVRRGKGGRYLDKSRIALEWAEGFPQVK